MVYKKDSTEDSFFTNPARILAQQLYLIVVELYIDVIILFLIYFVSVP